MDRTSRRRRGPRILDDRALTFEDGSVVLQSLLYGRILATIRTGLDFSQAELAGAMRVPTSTVSKLEQGAIVLAIHHLDAWCAAVNQLARGGLGGDPDWQGWQVQRLALDLSVGLTDAGFHVVWASEEQVPLAMRVPERQLGAMVKRLWPEGMRGKVGW